MKVYALVGKSGSGKSFHAMELCRKKNIDSIIDDGLFIYKNNVMAGTSAKREPTMLAAIKRAVFAKDAHRIEVARKIREVAPEAILIIGTSENMVRKIDAQLELPEISEIIQIEDITTAAEREIAERTRKTQGKHVVPAQAVQIKRQFSGYIMDPLRIFRGFGIGRSVDTERSVVRPTYSYLGDFIISERVITDICLHVAAENDNIIELKKVIPDNRDDEIRIRIQAVFSKNAPIIKTATKFQKECGLAVAKMTAFNIGDITVEVRGLG